MYLQWMTRSSTLVLMAWIRLQLRWRLVPSPWLIRAVFSDLLHGQVVFKAPEKEQRTQFRGHGLQNLLFGSDGNRLFHLSILTTRLITFPSPFSELTTKTAPLVPSPWSLDQGWLRAIYPNNTRLKSLQTTYFTCVTEWNNLHFMIIPFLATNQEVKSMSMSHFHFRLPLKCAHTSLDHWRSLHQLNRSWKE